LENVWAESQIGRDWPLALLSLPSFWLESLFFKLPGWEAKKKQQAPVQQVGYLEPTYEGLALQISSLQMVKKHQDFFLETVDWIVPPGFFWEVWTG